jgi:hypothetical protein
MNRSRGTHHANCRKHHAKSDCQLARSSHDILLMVNEMVRIIPRTREHRTVSLMISQIDNAQTYDKILLLNGRGLPKRGKTLNYRIADTLYTI